MAKLTYENRIEIYKKIKNGESPTYLSKQYDIGVDKIRYLVRLIDKHGYDILRTTKNRKFNSYEKEQIINRVLLKGEKENESDVSVEALLVDLIIKNKCSLKEAIKLLNEENKDFSKKDIYNASLNLKNILKR